MEIVKVWNILNTRNIELGLFRFDYGDISSHPLILKLTKFKYLMPLYYTLKLPEYIAPTHWRRLLGIKKTLVPSVFYHLGLTYLTATKLQLDTLHSINAIDICNDALDIRAKNAKHCCWEHPYSHHASAWRSSADHSIPESCAHHTARIGIMLLYVGIDNNNDRIIHSGISAAQALLDYHNWESHASGCTVSYYPFTKDGVINTGADTALLFSLIPDEYYDQSMEESLYCLINMICNEQNADGSWYYCTKLHYEINNGNITIDNHHTAMNILSLAEILKTNKVKETHLKNKIIQALLNGVEYYLNNFISNKGKAFYFPHSIRDAGIVGYSEGIRALIATNTALSSQVNIFKEKIDNTLPLLLDTAIKRYLNKNTGDVSCYVNFKIPYQISSARWGSLLLMHAITDYIEYIND